MSNRVSISQISSITGGLVKGNQKDLYVKHIATDSRAMPGVEEVMFAAIRGIHHNGNDYFDSLYARGVRIFLTDQPPHEKYPEAVFCIVEDVLKALQLIGKFKRESFNGKLIAVAGSNGKTIVKEWLYQLLEQFSTVVRSPRSYNSQLGVPLSLWLLDDSYEYAIIEAGISKPGEMQILEDIIQPDIGIFTNIGAAHGENFESDLHKLNEKLILFRNAEKIIFNTEINADGIPMISLLDAYKIHSVHWSSNSNSAKYSYKIKASDSQTTLLLSQTKGAPVSFNLPFIDNASIENLINAVTTLLEIGMPAKKINDGLQLLEPIRMRLETLKGVLSSTIISDGYNSDLTGLKVALDVLSQQKQHERKVVILSDIYQSGMNDQSLYAEAAGIIKFHQVDRVFCIGDRIGAQQKYFPSTTTYYTDVNDFLEHFNRNEIAHSAVLIKGARKYKFEKIVSQLQLQFQQTTLEINLNNLVSNLNHYRSLVKEETRIMVMVKALAYGSGAYEIAGHLQHQKVDYLAVAFPDEGVRLRKNGIQLPVMVMNSTSADYRLMMEYNLEPEIFNRNGLLEFIRECRYLGLKAQPIHVKLDTGMHRLGFRPYDLEWLCGQLKKEELTVKSVFSHLAGSEHPDFDEFTRHQVSQLQEMASSIRGEIGSGFLLHVLNSAGIERFPEYQFDMVRLGIGLYGMGISNSLLPVNTMRTVISQIHELQPGDTVSYGRRGRVDRKSHIAILPVGYADGIDRKLGNGNFHFMVKGKLVPTIGNICMDMSMIDVTGTDAVEGDEVELFGNNILVEHLAERLDTIVYEILTSIPERVKRVYIRE